MAFSFRPTQLFEDVVIIEGDRYGDNRGFFSETYRLNDFQQNGLPDFVQENHSRSTPGVFRGLHYQIGNHPQGKLVYCVSGSIIDYIVDIRVNSKTYGKFESVVLDSMTTKMVYLPVGYAHGFLVTGKEEAHVVYKVTDYYDKNGDRSISPYDPQINLNLPNGVLVSDKDAKAPLLENAETFYVLRNNLEE